MARPPKEGLDYFPHDTHEDKKLQRFFLLHGRDGYTFWWRTLEEIYAEGWKLDVSDMDTRLILARKVWMTVEEWDAMLQAALKLELFDRDLYAKESVLTSNGIRRRWEQVAQKRSRNAQHYRRSTDVSPFSGVSAGFQTSETHNRNDAESEDSAEFHLRAKVKESKEKKKEEGGVGDSVLNAQRLAQKTNDIRFQAQRDIEAWKTSVLETLPNLFIRFPGIDVVAQIELVAAEAIRLEELPPNLDLELSRRCEAVRDEARKAKQPRVTAEHAQAFELARKAYPGSKGGHQVEWDNFAKKCGKEIGTIIPRLIPAIEAERAHKARLQAAGQFVAEWKNFSTWVNKRCWEQELPNVTAPKSPHTPSPLPMDCITRDRMMVMHPDKPWLWGGEAA